MLEIISTYQITTDDGLVEIKEQANGIKIETLIEPSVEYLQKLADQPVPPEPEPTPTEILQEENASLWYENMIQSARVEANEAEVSDLWYELMQGGM